MVEEERAFVGPFDCWEGGSCGGAGVRGDGGERQREDFVVIWYSDECWHSGGEVVLSQLLLKSLSTLFSSEYWVDASDLCPPKKVCAKGPCALGTFPRKVPEILLLSSLYGAKSRLPRLYIIQLQCDLMVICLDTGL